MRETGDEMAKEIIQRMELDAWLEKYLATSPISLVDVRSYDVERTPYGADLTLRLIVRPDQIKTDEKE